MNQQRKRRFVSARERRQTAEAEAQVRAEWAEKVWRIALLPPPPSLPARHEGDGFSRRRYLNACAFAL